MKSIWKNDLASDLANAERIMVSRMEASSERRPMLLFKELHEQAIGLSELLAAYNKSLDVMLDVIRCISGMKSWTLLPKLDQNYCIDTYGRLGSTKLACAAIKELFFNSIQQAIAEEQSWSHTFIQPLTLKRWEVEIPHSVKSNAKVQLIEAPNSSRLSEEHRGQTLYVLPIFSPTGELYTYTKRYND